MSKGWMVIVVFWIVGMTNQNGFGSGCAFGEPEVCIWSFVGDIDQATEAEVLHLPDVVIVANIADVAVKAVGSDAQMEIARDHARVMISGSVRIISGNIETAMIDDVIEINAQTESMGDADHLKQFLFGTVMSGD